MKALFSTLTFNTTIAICSTFILLYFLLFYSETGSIGKLNNELSGNAKPDFYLTNVISHHFNTNGKKEFTVTSLSITHNPLDATSTITTPIVEVFDQGAKTWAAKSQLGILYDDNKKIELQNNVTIASNDQKSTIKTSQLSIFPSEQIAKTSERVTLSVPNGFTRSDGMHVNLQSSEISLLHNVKGQYNVSP
ncbi:MAG: LPS export ABC transporter protein LptC [Oceanicoccus sp.]|jgi:LPS export ABC transporter protein LptC